MSHQKSLIVQGAGGFWKLLTPDTAGLFLRQGFFGVGPSGDLSFAGIVSSLSLAAERRRELGQFGRDLAVERFSIDRATQVLERVYIDETEHRARRRGSSVVPALARYARFRVAVSAPGLSRAYRRVVRRRG